MNTRRLLLFCFVTLFELSATSHLAKANQPKTDRTPFAAREQWASDWKTGNVEGLRSGQGLLHHAPEEGFAKTMAYRASGYDGNRLLWTHTALTKRALTDARGDTA
jgi:hypothetical protein